MVASAHAQLFPLVITVENTFPPLTTVRNRFPSLVTVGNTFPFTITVSNRFPLVIIVVNRFPLVITFENTFPLLITVGNTFPLVITVRIGFPLVITVVNMFPLLITVGKNNGSSFFQKKNVAHVKCLLWATVDKSFPFLILLPHSFVTTKHRCSLYFLYEKDVSCDPTDSTNPKSVPVQVMMQDLLLQSLPSVTALLGNRKP